MDDDASQIPPPIEPERKSESPPEKPGPDFFEKTGVIFSPHPPVAALGAGTLPPQDEKIWAMLSHLLALVGFGFIAPLVIYIVQKDKSPFVASHARECLNFQLSYMIIFAACAMLMILVIPFFIAMGLGVLMIVAGIMAAIKAHEGDFMALPFTIRLIK